MTAGEIIFAVLVAIQGILFIIGAAFIIVSLIKAQKNKSDKLAFIAFILWAISPIFSIVGVFFGVFL